MKRISFNPRFVNEAGDDLINGKIHTIRKNLNYWQRFEGKEVALFIWEGIPYRSKQKVFCVKKIISVQQVVKSEVADFWVNYSKDDHPIPLNIISKNDGFTDRNDFIDWFIELPFSEYCILHFTDLRY